MGKSKSVISNELSSEGKIDETGGKEKIHPVDQSNWFSFATFSWMSPFMFASYRTNSAINSSHINIISEKERCRSNTERLQDLWNQELKDALKQNREPKFGRVIWRFVSSRVLATTLVFLISIILGFITPTLLMRKILQFASDPNAEIEDGTIWVLLLILCELSRVFFFTLTWALSYRTAIRVKTACSGIIYRKIFKIANMNSNTSSKLLNMISSDCQRIYDVVISTQIAIGGPVVLILCIFYIVAELGYLSLLGMIVFPLSYPIQYYLAKASGSLRQKSILIKDKRVNFISQAIYNLKFIKMFTWEKYFQKAISGTRLHEKNFLQKSQLVQSLSIVISPTLPHVGAIITFLLYINSGHELTPAQAFCVVALFSGRVRPTLNKVRAGFRSYFEALISINRIKCFIVLFQFSLFGYTIRAISQIFSFRYLYLIFIERSESILLLPEVFQTSSTQDFHTKNLIEINNATIIRQFNSEEKKKKGKSKKSEKKNQEENSVNKPLSCDITFKMENLNFTSANKKIGICGQVGSGKTTFLEGIAGCLRLIKGDLNVHGKIAYVPQEPWIFKGTLRENIIFGEEFDHVDYSKTLNACCLTSDFSTFTSGDLTETCENGSNLSGGQKQRICLARALYHHKSREIFLLDDPFSGLDSRVSKTIHEKVIKGLLKKKTLLLVTHQLQHLRDCDEILVFSAGQIVEQGTHEQLLALKGHYANLYQNLPETNDNNNDIIIEEESEPYNLKSSSSRKKDKDTSNVMSGKLSWNVYKLYIKSAGGFCAVIFVLLAFGLGIGSTAFSSWWLKHWFSSAKLEMNETDERNETIFKEVISQHSPNYITNRNIYAWTILVILILSFFRTLLFVLTTIKASQGLHKLLLSQFFRNRLHSTEKVGSGQIINLFSRDMDEIDTNLPTTLEFFLQNIFIVISVLTLVSMVFPFFLIPLLILFAIFIFFRKIYNSAIRDLKRIENDSKSPIFTKVSETVSGLGTIRAFGKEEVLILKFEVLLDWHHSVFYTFQAAVRWLSFRLDALAVSVTGITAAFILLFHGQVSAAACGLALSYAAQLSGIFQFTVRLASETEAKFVSVERIHSFLHQSNSEETDPDSKRDRRRSKEIKEGKSDDCEATLILPISLPKELEPSWPNTGKLSFCNVSLSYSAGTEALRGISFQVASGQKIGIIGRTGSGKSSIGSSLFRIIEPTGGEIQFDGVNIQTLKLDRLRRSLCVIPQDAAIFQNTIRFNLDPGGEYSDNDIWTVLEKTTLKTSIDSLDSEVSLSHGQKQLLSIARAILRKSKLIFIDEATSSIDSETETIMNQVLNREFLTSTVLTVAHRLSALSYCDHLLILSEGEIKDYGPKNVIIKKPEFYSYFENLEMANK